MGEKRHFGGKLSIFFHLVFDAPRASGLDAIGSPRVPLPDPSLKTGTCSTGAPAEWFERGHQVWSKNAILG